MITLSRVDQMLASADPLLDTPEIEVDVDRLVRAARDRAGADLRPGVGPPSGVRRRRRIVVAGAAAVGVAAAVAVPLLVPSGASVAPTAAAAQELRHVVAMVSRSGAVNPLRSTSHEYVLNVIRTTRGPAYYWQESTTTTTVLATSTERASTYGAPAFLSPRDRARAAHPIRPDRVLVGSVRTRDDACGRNCSALPPEVLAALPSTDPDALARAFHRAVENSIGGCAEGVGCRAQNMIALLQAPGVPGRVRALALQALATASGVTVLGTRTVAGVRGLVLRNAHGGFGGRQVETLVIDTSTGFVLSDALQMGTSDRALYHYPVPLGTVIDRTTTVS